MLKRICCLLAILLPLSAYACMPGPGSAHWEQTLHDIPTPELHAFAPSSACSNAPFFSTTDLTGISENAASEAFFIPEDFRKYQNSHKAPVRIYTGCTAVAVGG